MERDVRQHVGSPVLADERGEQPQAALAGDAARRAIGHYAPPRGAADARGRPPLRLGRPTMTDRPRASAVGLRGPPEAVPAGWAGVGVDTALEGAHCGYAAIWPAHFDSVKLAAVTVPPGTTRMRHG